MKLILWCYIKFFLNTNDKQILLLNLLLEWKNDSVREKNNVLINYLIIKISNIFIIKEPKYEDYVRGDAEKSFFI